MTREEAIKWIEAFQGTYATMSAVNEATNMAIAALQESERNHGHWIDGKTYYDAIERNCSECGGLLTTAKSQKPPFCPHCGAIMDGKMLTGWIPVGECLPADEEMVLVSCKTMKGIKSVNRAYYSNGSWHGSGSMSGVQAWMPMPEPYEEEK